MPYLETSVENKKVIWIRDVNRYLLVELPAYHVITKLLDGAEKTAISQWLCSTYLISQADAVSFIAEIEQLLKEQAQSAGSGNSKKISVSRGLAFSENYSHKFYQANGVVFSVEYENEGLEYLIHSKFAHLEIEPQEFCEQYYFLFQQDSSYVLQVNDKIIGQWEKEFMNFFTGKFSMELTNMIYGVNENNWMGVFHAAGVSNRKESIMFLGESGNGKSTLSAILLANKYEVLADDFLPVENETSYLCHFPAAISVKKNAIEILSEKFPDLLQAKEYINPYLDKVFRYLPNYNFANNTPQKVPCKALVFVKYRKGAKLKFEALPKDIAFNKLIPDSWISPLQQNVKNFLDWFTQMPCYELVYSETGEMLNVVNKIFGNEL